MSTTEAEFIQLRAENEALKALLAKHGIAVPQPSKFNIGDAALQPTANGLSQTAKVQLFRRLFRGRDDIYPVRWINKAGKPGYSPLCTNKWKPGVCKLPVIKCSAFSYSLYAPIPVDDPSTCARAGENFSSNWIGPSAPSSRSTLETLRISQFGRVLPDGCLGSSWIE
jgi:hypothetical protein